MKKELKEALLMGAVAVSLLAAAQDPACPAKEAVARAQGGERPQPLIRECVSDHLDDLSRALEWKAEINRQMEQAAMAERERRAVEFREK
jgi:hypothetical protein